jgi:hypothetical protein
MAATKNILEACVCVCVCVWYALGGGGSNFSQIQNLCHYNQLSQRLIEMTEKC